MPLPDDLFDTPKPARAASSALPDDLFGPVTPAAPKAKNWQDNLQPFRFNNGTTSVQRPDGAVYFKEANDPSAKGAEGWRARDERTGAWLPASPVDTLWLEDQDRAIAQRFGYDFDLIKGAKNNLTGGYKPGSLLRIQDEQSVPESGTRTGRFMHGAGDVGFAIQQFVDRLGEKTGRNNRGSVALAELTNKILESKYQKTKPEGVDWMRMGGAAVPSAVLLPGPGRLNSFKAVGKAAGLGAAGAALQPVLTETEDGGATDGFWAAKGKQATMGAVAAPVVQGAVEKVALPVVGATINAARNRLRPGVVPAKELGEKFGVRMTAGDITGSPAMQKTEVALEQIPGMGMPALRKAQNAEAQAAAQKMRDEIFQEMNTKGWGNLDDVKSAASGGSRRAQALLSEIESAGDDWNQILQTSGNLNLFKQKLKADALYAKVGEMAGDQEVPLVNTLRAIQEAKDEIMSSALPDEQALALLGKLEAKLTATREAAGEAAQAVGGGTTTAALPTSQVDLSYTGLGRLRSDLGDLVSDYYKGANAATGTKGAGILQRVKAGVEADMEGFAASRPGTKEAWNEAQRFYRQNVVPYKNRALASALKDAPADTVYSKFVKASATEGQAQKFFSALDPKGQAAVRFGMVQEALDAATKEAASEGGAVFSPAKFAKYLEDISASRGVAFKGQSKWEIDGLTKLMRHVQRAGQFAENPPTGNRLGPLLVGGAGAAAWMNPALAAKVFASAAGARLLLTTPAGKRLLLAASELQPGSRVMEDLLTSRLPQITGALTGQAMGGDAPMEAEPETPQP